MEIRIDTNPSKEAVHQLQHNLLEYNRSKVPEYRYEEFIIKLMDASHIMAGAIHCRAGCGWLYIEALWVEEGFRYQGLGKKLVCLAEAEAKKRGCIGMYLYNYSFQSPEFYKTLGFQSLGAIKPFAGPHAKHYMVKGLE